MPHPSAPPRDDLEALTVPRSRRRKPAEEPPAPPLLPPLKEALIRAGLFGLAIGVLIGILLLNGGLTLATRDIAAFLAWW